MRHTEESLMALADEWYSAGEFSERAENREHLRLAIREVLAERDHANQAWDAAIEHANHMTGELEKAEAKCEWLRILLKRARWFVKQENDACVIACSEDPNYCCADTLTAIDAAMKEQP